MRFPILPEFPNDVHQGPDPRASGIVEGSATHEHHQSECSASLSDSLHAEGCGDVDFDTRRVGEPRRVDVGDLLLHSLREQDQGLDDFRLGLRLVADLEVAMRLAVDLVDSPVLVGGCSESHACQPLHQRRFPNRGASQDEEHLFALELLQGTLHRLQKLLQKWKVHCQEPGALPGIVLGGAVGGCGWGLLLVFVRVRTVVDRVRLDPGKIHWSFNPSARCCSR
mmetsp:Transcript_2033/g.4707  ORF Transcript_2033/g.4707 Transcript_2033/m.4707 type:complete len:224 (+) Transcript_2033:1193-1864(+)